MNSFSGFIPIAINFLRRLPVIGSILLLPGIRQVSIIMCMTTIIHSIVTLLGCR